MDHPAVVAVAPAVGYLIAYLDRLGEALAYGIPPDYISVSITDALSRVSVVFVGLLGMVALARLEDALARRLPRWAREPLNTASTWLLFSLLAVVLAWRMKAALYIAALGVVWTLIHSAWSFARRRKIGPPEHTARIDSGPIILGEKAVKPPQLQIQAVLVIALLVAAFFFAFVGGNIRATSRERYLVPADDSKTVLLAIYGDKAVLGQLETEGSDTLTGGRQLVTLPGETEDYVWQNTGPLQWEDGFAMMPLATLGGTD